MNDRAKARWVITTEGYKVDYYRCSLCGRVVTIEQGKKEALLKRFPYCHCGAKMEVDE